MQTGGNTDAYGCLQGSDNCKLRATIHKYRNIDLAVAQVKKIDFAHILLTDRPYSEKLNGL